MYDRLEAELLAIDELAQMIVDRKHRTRAYRNIGYALIQNIMLTHGLSYGAAVHYLAGVLADAVQEKRNKINNKHNGWVIERPSVSIDKEL